MTSPLEFGVMLINLGGGLALFLYGMHKMTEALKIVAGERVRDFLARLTTNRFSAAFAGATVTAVIQSFDSKVRSRASILRDLFVGMNRLSPR